MIALTASEERICQKLRNEGFNNLADVMKERYIRQHELFENLQHADIRALYGAYVSETVLNALKAAIANRDYDLVASLHSWCEVSKDKSKESSRGRLMVTGDPTATAYGLLAFAVIFAILIAFMGV